MGFTVCKLHQCLDSYMSHNITVDSESSFIRDLCLIIDDYTVFNNCAITNEEVVFIINHLRASSHIHMFNVHVCLHLVFCRSYFYIH